MQRVTVLGATGSIGQSTLRVLVANKHLFSVFALTANRNSGLLVEQCREVDPQYAVVADDAQASAIQDQLTGLGCRTQVLQGRESLHEVSMHVDVDIVVAGIVGAVGLMPTLAAVAAGKRVLLANKESLVMSGRLFTEAVSKSGAQLLPVDSEHNAIFQCLPDSYGSLAEAGVSKILLTGSGGPFRTLDSSELVNVTPDQACAHPNWVMGRKISVDSATMMNKGLEFIEACWLFGARTKEIEVIIHPQSIVHSMVAFIDGSTMAQMGKPDMRTPIAHCLHWPKRIQSGVKALDFAEIGELSFETPDFRRFPCLRLALDAANAGGDFPTALNAANEVAVDLFLEGRIKFTQIAILIAETLSNWDSFEPDSVAAVIESDQKARRRADELVGKLRIL